MSGTLGGQDKPLYVKMGDDSWAKDSTLNKIFNALPKRWREATEEQTQATKVQTKATEEGNKGQKTLSEKFEKMPWQLKGAISQVLTTGLGPGGSVFGQLSQASKGLSQQLSSTAPEWQKTITYLNKFSLGLSLAKMAVDKMFEVDKIFTDIYGSGVRLEGGLQGLITSSSLAGMTLQDFGSLMTKNSTTIAALSGRGVPRLIESFQKATSSGGEFIMSLQENAETFLQTAEIYQQSGITASLTNDQLVGSSRRFIGEITKASEATGMSRKSLLDFVGSLTKTGGSFLLLSTMTDKARENFVNASAQLAKFGQAGGKLLYDNIQKYIAGGGTFGLLDDSMLKLVATVPGLGNSFQNLAESFQKDGKMTDEALNDFAKTLVGAPKALRQQLLAAMPEVAGVLGDLIQNAERVAQQEKDRHERILKEERETGVSYAIIKKRYEDQDRMEKEELQRRKGIMTEYESSMNQFNNELTRVYTSLAEGLTPVLKIVSTAVGGLADVMLRVNQFITSFLPTADKDKTGLIASLLPTKSGPDATSGAGGLLGMAGMATAGYLAYRGTRSLIGGVRSRFGRKGIPSEAPLIPGMDKGMTASDPLFVSIVGPAGLPSAAPGIPGMGGGGGPAGAAGRGGRLGSMLGGAGRLLGRAFGPLAIGMSLFDAFQGFTADPSAGFGGKLLNAGSSALSGLSFGLLGSSPADIAARAGAGGQRNPEQAAGQMSVLEQIDNMLANRQGLNVQYTETGQALRDFSTGYRELISAVSLPAAGDLSSVQRLLALASQPRASAVTPAEYGAENWQTDVKRTWISIKELNEVMVGLLSRIAGSMDSMVSASPVQGAGMPPG